MLATRHHRGNFNHGHGSSNNLHADPTTQGSRRLLIPEEEHSINMSAMSNYNDEQSRLEESKRLDESKRELSVSNSHSDKTPVKPSPNQLVVNKSLNLTHSPLQLIPAADPELEDDQHDEHATTSSKQQEHRDKEHNEGEVWVE